MNILIWIVSIIAVAFFFAHFWCGQRHKLFGVLWGISAFSATWCIYACSFALAEAPNNGYALCGLVWGIIIFSALVATGLAQLGRLKN